MSEIAPPPRAVEPFIGFVAILRANGFAVAPEQTAVVPLGDCPFGAARSR